MNKKDIPILILRIIAFPFVAGLLFIYSTYQLLKTYYLFLVYGGEFITMVKGDKKRIYDLFDILQKQYNEQLNQSDNNEKQ